MDKLKQKEFLYALILALIILAVVVMTSDQSPQWIYQGF